MPSATRKAAALTRDTNSPLSASFDAPLQYVMTQVFKQPLTSPFANTLAANGILDIHALISGTEQDVRELTWLDDQGEEFKLLVSHVRLIMLFKSFIVEQVPTLLTPDDDKEWLDINPSDFSLYRIYGSTPSAGDTK